MIQKILSAADGILHLPICDTGIGRYIEVWDASSPNRKLAEFFISLEVNDSKAYYPMYLSTWNTETVELRCLDEDAPKNLFDGILTGGTMEERTDLYPNLYRESERQQIHFSSRRGWLNDPNGLVYVNGEFHMCYQHNPYGNRHGGVNVSWGLAVSNDGVHYHEYPDVIRPTNCQTLIASGSAIVDQNNILGKGAGTVLAAYTALESLMYKGKVPTGTKGQYLMYSTDGGYTFLPFSEEPVIRVAKGEHWRDPKLLQLDETHLCMAVYETYSGKNCVSFYSTENCIDWKFESRTMDLYECPDLFPLTVAETGKKLWVLYGGDGRYRVGTFENYRFEQIEPCMYMDYGNAVYAGQTWNSHPDPTCRYHLAWLREIRCRGIPCVPGLEHCSSQPFSQSMSVICQLTLHQTESGYRLFRTPNAALNELRQENSQSFCEHVGKGMLFTYSVPTPSETLFTLDAKESTYVIVNGYGFQYHPDTKKLVFTGGKEYTLAKADVCTVRILTDTRSIEFFISEEISASFICADPEKKIYVSSDHANVSGTTWSLQSIWETDRDGQSRM